MQEERRVEARLLRRFQAEPGLNSDRRRQIQISTKRLRLEPTAFQRCVNSVDADIYGVFT